MISGIISHVVVAVAGVIAGIFFYRNNQSKVSKIADVADNAYDKVKEQI